MLLKRISWVFALFMVASVALYAGPTKEAGKELFTANCASCHAKNMKDKLTGPALGGSQARWGDDKALYAWIRNSQALIAAGHPRAVELWNQYKPVLMNSFTSLKDDDIASILLYVEDVYVNGGKTVNPNTPVEGETKEESDNSMWIFGGLAVLLGLLAFALMRIIDHLGNVSRTAAGEAAVERSWVHTLASKGFVAFLVFASTLILGYKTVDNATQMGRSQNYEPDQPIKFSHKLHAGLNKIECQYCHDSARRSKHSSIPGTNTCMNCHSAVKKGSQYGTAELTKIFASIGFDPITGKYVDGYENWSDAQIEDLYKKWIGQEYMSEKSLTALDEAGKDLVQNQWDGIVAALKNDSNGKIQGPIEWTRIHNLPDHAYFNHAQHVNIGQIACQKCHGPIQEMEVVYQYSSLGMGWCINCHRETEVKFGNGFYKNYKSDYIKAHKKALGKTDAEAEKVVVEDIGGLECQKCHY
jgi:mono/diheme cytochrome c family protein